MVGFGCDNKEICSRFMPFLLRTVIDSDRSLHIFIAGATKGETLHSDDLSNWNESLRAITEQNPGFRERINGILRIDCDYESVWEISFESYELLMERDESYATSDKQEVFKGKTLLLFERSMLLDDAAKYTFSDFIFNCPPTHYGIYCADHILDILSRTEPEVRKLSFDEMTAIGSV